MRAKVKQAEIEEARRAKEAAGGSNEGGFFSSVKNWTNKQVSRFSLQYSDVIRICVRWLKYKG